MYKAVTITMNRSMRVFAVFVYIKLWMLDMIEYYLIYLLLHLPAFVFGPPTLLMQQPDPSIAEAEDSDDEEVALVDYTVYIAQLAFVFKTDATPQMKHITMHGAQLRMLVDTKGRLLLPRLSLYYPSLDTVIIRYCKYPSDGSKESPTLVKVLDVAKRYDIRNGVSCKMGVVF
jgi:hypothetical protein